jgi:hypothetical protein
LLEHGPYGGDEINIQNNIDSLYNFGWPISSYGEHYPQRAGFGNHIKGDEKKLEKIKKGAPLYKSHKNYGFTEPFKYFVPSIGISEIEYFIKENKYYLLSSSMGDNPEDGDMSIHIIELGNNKTLKVLNFEDRIRDLVGIGGRKFIISFEGKYGGGIGILEII